MFNPLETLVICIILHLSLISCANFSYDHDYQNASMAQSKGSYKKAEEFLEQSQKSLSELLWLELQTGTNTYLNSKNFKKAAKHIDEMEKRVKKGDYISKKNTFFDHDCRVDYCLAKLRYFLTMGRYNEAILFLTNNKNMYHDSLKTYHSGWQMHYRLLEWGYLGAAYALKGEPNETKKYIQKFDDYYQSLRKSQLEPHGPGQKQDRKNDRLL